MSAPVFECLAAGSYRVIGALSFATVPALMSTSSGLFGQNKAVSLALDGVERIDSAGLALLVSLVRQARQADCTLTLTGAPEQLLGLARVGGVDHILPLA